MKKNDISGNSPIGVFDSGLGGLTVVRELKRLLPNEDIVYLGDSARLPYGIKSKKQIVQFSKNNAMFLLSKKVKAVVIACNSSSANAYNSLKNILPVPVIDVIRPASGEACAATSNGRVGIIGTSATIQSGAYQNAIKKINSKIKVYSQSCPLFVNLVEEGWLDDEITGAVALRYLSGLVEKEIDTLVLGCTHYPLLKKIIQRTISDQIKIVDSGPSAGNVLRDKLKKSGLLSARKREGVLRIFVSDLSDHFVRIGESFLGQRLDNIRVVDV